MGLLAVDVTAFGVVMSADSQPIEAQREYRALLGSSEREGAFVPSLKGPKMQNSIRSSLLVSASKARGGGTVVALSI